MSYRVVAIDLLTGTVLDEIPFDSIDVDHQPLSDHGSLGLTVSIREPRAAALRPARTLLVVERGTVADGAPVVGHGIVWARNATDGSWEVEALGLSSILDRLHIRHDLSFSTDPQDDVIGELIAYAQGLDAGGLGAGTDLSIVHEIAAASTGITRTRDYYGWERKNLGEAFAQLGAVIDGFDWRPEVIRNPDHTYTRRISTAYPGFGSTVVDVGLVLGSTVDSYGSPEDGTRMVTAVDTVGAGEEDETLIGTWDPGPPSGYPRLEGVYAYRDVVEPSTLESHARAIQESRAAPVSLPPLVLSRTKPDGSWDPVESVSVGDTVPVLIQDGTVDVDGPYRIVRRTISVDGNTGDETVTVDVTAPRSEELPT